MGKRMKYNFFHLSWILSLWNIVSAFHLHVHVRIPLRKKIAWRHYIHTNHSSPKGHPSSVITTKSSRRDDYDFTSDDDDDDLYPYGLPSHLASHERSSSPSSSSSPTSRASGSGSGSAPRNESRNRVVWIIDDEQPILDAMGSFFNTVGGYDVYPFLNATLPVSLLSHSNDNGSGKEPHDNENNSHVVVPDAIISDIRMPHMSGIDLLTMIRSSSDSSILNMPFILLTARSLVEDRIRGYDAGTDGYLMKPFDPEELIVLLERIIQRKEWMEESTRSSVTLEELKDDLEQIKDALLVEEENLFLHGSSFNRGRGGGGGSRGERVNNNNQPGGEDVDYNIHENDYVNDTTSPLLNPDEMDVLELLCQGYTNKEIAFELQYSVRWVEGRLTAMYRKTGCSNRTELVRYAIANDFVDM